MNKNFSISEYNDIYSSKIVSAAELMASSYRVILCISNTHQTIPVKAGFIAEEIHAFTYNLDAIWKGYIAEAYTDRHSSFYEFGGVHNAPHDIAILTEISTLVAQVKFYADARKTSVQLRKIKDDRHVYDQMRLITPFGQANDVRMISKRTSLRAKACARRKVVELAALYVSDDSYESIELDDVFSQPIEISVCKDIAQHLVKFFFCSHDYMIRMIDGFLYEGPIIYDEDMLFGEDYNLFNEPDDLHMPNSTIANMQTKSYINDLFTLRKKKYDPPKFDDYSF